MMTVYKSSYRKQLTFVSALTLALFFNRISHVPV